MPTLRSPVEDGKWVTIDIPSEGLGGIEGKFELWPVCSHYREARAIAPQAEAADLLLLRRRLASSNGPEVVGVLILTPAVKRELKRIERQRYRARATGKRSPKVEREEAGIDECERIVFYRKGSGYEVRGIEALVAATVLDRPVRWCRDRATLRVDADQFEHSLRCVIASGYPVWVTSTSEPKATRTQKAQQDTVPIETRRQDGQEGPPVAAGATRGTDGG